MTVVAGPGPFVGRRREQELLLRRLNAVRSGSGSVAFLAGKPGIGKTRIAREVAAAAREHGAVVLWGACFEGEWTPPFGPWVEALGEYINSLDPAHLTEDLGPGAPLLGQLVPEAGALASMLIGPPSTAGQDRYLLYDAVTRLLTAGVQDSPLALVLDDLHWADGDSLALLRHVARLTRRAPLLLMLAYRDAEVDAKHPLAPVLAALHREAECDHLQLRGLSTEDVDR